jgi:hypothetical protein
MDVAVKGLTSMDPRLRGDDGFKLILKLSQTVNDDPQPQVDFAFGLRMVNWAPCRLSL